MKKWLYSFHNVDSPIHSGCTSTSYGSNRQVMAVVAPGRPMEVVYMCIQHPRNFSFFLCARRDKVITSLPSTWGCWCWTVKRTHDLWLSTSLPLALSRVSATLVFLFFHTISPQSAYEPAPRPILTKPNTDWCMLVLPRYYSKPCCEDLVTI